MEAIKRRSHLRVIKGGRTHRSAPNSEFRFVSGYVTDTRLMGVLVVYIRWKLVGRGFGELHQFFYYDAEEYGLETYKHLYGDDPSEFEAIEQAMTGGLGGARQPINEREARYLVQSFVEASRLLDSPPAEPVSEYRFLLDPPTLLNEKEHRLLVGKICTVIPGNEPLIHYFLMRSFARDATGAGYLATDESVCQGIMPAFPATLYRNTIDVYEDAEGNRSYLCEALTERDGQYGVQILEIQIAQGLVSSAVQRSAFRVSPAEAAMQLNRPEYVTVYEILTEPEEFDEYFMPLVRSAMPTAHESGRLFIEFHHTNEHIHQRTFRLNDDIMGMYYVTDFGQLLLAAYTLADIRALERGLARTPLSTSLLPDSKYEFKDPILYEFIHSGFDDFNDFIETLQKR